MCNLRRALNCQDNPFPYDDPPLEGTPCTVSGPWRGAIGRVEGAVFPRKELTQMSTLKGQASPPPTVGPTPICTRECSTRRRSLPFDG